MSTILEMLANERTLLGDPNPMAPNPRAQWRSLLAHIQSMYNQTNNSGAAWGVYETELTVTPNEEEYLISGAPLLGKPMLVFTKDDGNTAHIERPVEIVQIEDLPLAYYGPRNGSYVWPGYWDGSNHTANAFAFYQKLGAPNWYANLRPVPQLEATYRIMYVVGDWVSTAAPGSIPILPEHHHLLTIRAALSDLPNCEWDDLSAKSTDPDKAAAWQRTYNARREMLLGENVVFTQDFQLYIRSLTKSRITFRRSGFYY